ncbi:hypothetical protein PF008_g24279 [Phytophthora fragariae]|uniref:Uncharacterized protein n=1 Tax=Phytophthora fragariae TaxID=53985 RepID=A0A6G0QP63_9STRA|nr:hypothetical protein PF003_g15331 [Phytophthora fragariae]KAE9295373.1 hypothetical protein PF008_g24279 [Phytophthora fragariae]
MAATPGAVVQRPVARTAPGSSSSDDLSEPLSDSSSQNSTTNSNCWNSQSLRAMVRAVADGCGREWSQA